MGEKLQDLVRKAANLDEGAIEAAWDRHRASGEDFPTAVLELGLLSENDLSRVLSRYCGFPAIDLGASIVPVGNLDLVPPEVSRGTPVLVVAEEGAELLVAVADPSDQRMLVKLRAVTGRQVLPHIAISGVLEKAVEGLHEARLRGEAFWRGPRAPEGEAPRGRASVVRADMPASAVPQPSASAQPPLLDDSAFEAVELPPPPRPPAKPHEKNPELKRSLKSTKTAGIGIGRVVLVVDDTEALRKLVCSVLQPMGVALLEAGDGRRGLQLAREAQPDIVILDAMLPGMHGFEVCRAIKGDPALRRARVLMVSAIYTGWKVSVDVRSTFGADAFLEKPFRVEELQKLVHDLLLPTLDKADAQRLREQALGLCTRAADASRSGQREEAIHLLRQAAEADPFSAEPHLYLGQLLRAMQQPYQAVAALERAVELRPDLFRPLAELAVAYEGVGFRNTAREVYGRALEACQEPAKAELIRRRIEALAGA